MMKAAQRAFFFRERAHLPALVGHDGHEAPAMAGPPALQRLALDDGRHLAHGMRGHMETL